MIWGALAGAGVGLAAAGAFLLHPRWLVSWLNRRVPGVLFCVDTDEPVVALTIDDGPHAGVTPRILDVLAKHNSSATFFVIGDRIPGNEDVLQRTVDEGHELGNHLFTDSPSILLSDAEFERQLLAVDRLIQTGETRWFRPGSGWFNRTMLATAKRHGYRCALGSAYPLDARLPIVPWIVDNALVGLQPGAILVLHEGNERRPIVDVLDTLLPAIQDLGLRVVTLSKLQQLQPSRAVSPVPGGFP